MTEVIFNFKCHLLTAHGSYIYTSEGFQMKVQRERELERTLSIKSERHFRNIAVLP